MTDDRYFLMRWPTSYSYDEMTDDRHSMMKWPTTEIFKMRWPTTDISCWDDGQPRFYNEMTDDRYFQDDMTDDRDSMTRWPTTEIFQDEITDNRHFFKWPTTDISWNEMTNCRLTITNHNVIFQNHKQHFENAMLLKNISSSTVSQMQSVRSCLSFSCATLFREALVYF